MLGDNLILVDFENKRDKERVLEGRPWVFEGSLLAVEDYDGLRPLTQIQFDRVTFWVRMISLSLAYMSLTIGQQIGSLIGHVEKVDVDDGGMVRGEYLQVKVNLDLHKPLMRERILRINGSFMLIGFQYESLPKFCFRCGVIKHGITGCAESNGARKQNAPIEFMRRPRPANQLTSN